MSPVNIWRELSTALAAVGVEQDKHLIDLGLSDNARLMCGTAKVRTAGWSYWPDDSGRSMVITPLYNMGEVVDMVAWHPREPERWWRRLGRCPYAGADAIDRTFDGEPLIICRTMLRWLQRGAKPNAMVVLDWACAGRDIPTGMPIAGEDIEHTKFIESKLAAPRRRYLVPRQAA